MGMGRQRAHAQGDYRPSHPFPWRGRAGLSRVPRGLAVGWPSFVAVKPGKWDPRREGKNHGCRKSFPNVRLSFCPTNLGALITLPTQTHHEELI